MTSKTPFHEGERAIQQRAGESAVADRNVTLVSDTVIGGARPFIAKQFMVVLGSVDASGDVWASALFGQPGFIHTTDGRAIQIDVPEGSRDPVDPLWTNIASGRDLGMLFIELGSRRRYRVNGTVSRIDGNGIDVSIREAYPNCPKYIQRRHLRALGASEEPAQAAYGTVLRGNVTQLIQQADTLFVATHHVETGADASHRGGGAGFIQIVDEQTLRIPDYHGNSLFNTLGNLQADSRAGLYIPDFANGQSLQLTGTATVEWDQADPDRVTGGTGRFWVFHVAKWILRDAIPRAEWEYLDASPFNPPVAS
ncbi:pyridoxamine 5'-phosphate oxidase [Luteibacter rhizovicinus DSM 16549]|uniref:Pyridoxamine 5'-phosphate oxidase n=1 Tax=Luteibacter rhizovicinus DSM 16549 TaxID=1440763 RepID=A0A0G9HC36_9GAMM|nr:pyridoxamine 5'-phosphate oxidase family protein [Luteibacter rhizovicinus]APG05550.1 pyridoxamine 5'-phosphate oxidase [Luteibacter rhizovicinus DSM 16549]KLD67056.1 pyridoxamine 5'-phosphate oxidase [Luteibacter rhizovicinus DSM 16549]KLD79653.1 pyridoxamine 5'-phosphate oxidase [Xanthomonas hyacinthi DSM 19077]